MKKITILSAACAIVLSITVLAACNLGGAKKNDPKAVYTAAAETVSARLTSIGPLTPAPSVTPFPSITPPAAATGVFLPTLTSAAGPTLPAVSPTSNASVADKAQYLSQNPADGAQLAANTKFKMTWTVKNVGKTTWKTSYLLRFYAGSPLGGSAAVNLPKEVKPDEQVDVSVDLTAPSSAGEYNTIWVLTNEAGANFQALTLDLKVTAGPTATSTVGITPTVQATTAVPTAVSPSETPETPAAPQS